MQLKQADASHLEAFYELIRRRIVWMEENGIRQWNVTDYWGVYPEDYYARQQEQGRLYILENEGRLLAAGVVFEEDPRWENSGDVPAWYLHHFAAFPEVRGAGVLFLRELERQARELGKQRLRLDCAVDNPRLNRYYEELGYAVCGSCVDGVYEGITREKIL